MHGKTLIFSRGGVGRGGPIGPQRPYGVSPLRFSQDGLLNHYFLPDKHQLPMHGLLAQVLVFDFGFSVPSQTIGSMDSQFFQVAMVSDFLASWVTGVSDVPPSQNVSSVPASGSFSGVQGDPAFLVTFQQTHAGNTWQWVNKGVTNREFCGSAQSALPLTSPVLIPAGDSVGCTVQNMGNTSLRVQIVLVGASF